MRVLHLLASPYLSGPAESIVLLALAQRALGHDVSLAFDRKRTHTDAEELLAPRVEAAGLADPLPLELSVKSTPLAVWRDVRALRGAAVDVVHAHLSHDHFLARWAGGAATLVRSIHKPTSLSVATPRAHGWTVPSDEQAGALLGRPVIVLPPLIDSAFCPADRLALRKRLGLPSGRLVGMVSTFQPSRRHALGIEAFSRLEEGHLVLVGDGALLHSTRTLVERKGLRDRVHFVGYQAGPDFAAHLQALDEVWVLGLGNDWAARVAAQARACEVRVVAVDEGALGRYADAMVPPEPSAIAAQAFRADRRSLELESNEAIATRVVELYRRARAARSTAP